MKLKLLGLSDHLSFKHDPNEYLDQSARLGLFIGGSLNISVTNYCLILNILQFSSFFFFIIINLPISLEGWKVPSGFFFNIINLLSMLKNIENLFTVIFYNVSPLSPEFVIVEIRSENLIHHFCVCFCDKFSQI